LIFDRGQNLNIITTGRKWVAGEKEPVCVHLFDNYFNVISDESSPQRALKW
jgi:hypothetical protein